MTTLFPTSDPADRIGDLLGAAELLAAELRIQAYNYIAELVKSRSRKISGFGLNEFGVILAAKPHWYKLPDCTTPFKAITDRLVLVLPQGIGIAITDLHLTPKALASLAWRIQHWPQKGKLK